MPSRLAPVRAQQEGAPLVGRVRASDREPEVGERDHTAAVVELSGAHIGAALDLGQPLLLPDAGLAPAHREYLTDCGSTTSKHGAATTLHGR